MFKQISFRHILALGLLIPFNVIIWKVLTQTVPSENREILAHTIGMLEGFLSAIVMFHYGDSSGSKRKTEILNNQLNEKNLNDPDRNPKRDPNSSDMPD